MNDFLIVAITLLLFLGFGIAMGMLIVVAFSRRRRSSGYMDGGGWERPELPEHDERPAWYDG